VRLLSGSCLAANRSRRLWREIFEALTLVFTDSDYHSGDNESWDFTAWPLLHAVGDTRFAAWLRTLDEKTKNKVFDHVFYAGSYYSRAIRDGYFRRKFPEVEAIYRTLHRNDLTSNQSMKPTAPDRITEGELATDPARGLSFSR
jgi:hypothetical protein